MRRGSRRGSTSWWRPSQRGRSRARRCENSFVHRVGVFFLSPLSRRGLTRRCRGAARAAGVRRAPMVGAARGGNGGGRERGARPAAVHGAGHVHLARRLQRAHRLRGRGEGGGGEDELVALTRGTGETTKQKERTCADDEGRWARRRRRGCCIGRAATAVGSRCRRSSCSPLRCGRAVWR